MIRAAVVRFTGLLVAISLGTVLLSVAVGFGNGSSALRSMSVGFYVVGSVLLLFGFFVANRGPVRPQPNDPGVGLVGPLFQTRMLRWATAEDVGESLNMSAVFVALGLVLIILGAATDTRYPLF
ncbi:MAG: hypothetical protein ABI948_01800 [Thermoleophilia bacterium]